MDYREALNKRELEQLFNLRYTVYAEDPHLYKMLSENSPYDINPYDLNALHFGAFDGDSPVAYIRISTLEETHFTPWVVELADKHGMNLNEPETQFPFQLYYPDPGWSTVFIQSLNGKKIGEVGKLAIHKNYRQGGKVLDELITAFVQYCKNEQGFNTGFGSCSLLLERYYRKFGFEVADGAQAFVYNEFPEAIIVRFDR